MSREGKTAEMLGAIAPVVVDVLKLDTLVLVARVDDTVVCVQPPNTEQQSIVNLLLDTALQLTQGAMGTLSAAAYVHGCVTDWTRSETRAAAEEQVSEAADAAADATSKIIDKLRGE